MIRVLHPPSFALSLFWGYFDGANQGGLVRSGARSLLYFNSTNYLSLKLGNKQSNITNFPMVIAQVLPGKRYKEFAGSR